MHDLDNILSEISQDNLEEFKRFYNIFYPEINRFINYFEINEFFRDDIIADVFITLWARRAKIPNIKNIRNYLFICTKNEILKYNKKMHLKMRIPLQTEDEIPERHLHFLTENSIESDLEEKQMISIINDLIESLPKRCKIIYKLIKYERLSYAETAELLGISEKTVQSQMIIAVKKLGNAIRNTYERSDI
ncbi:MAG: sigma-70 family RNA polymerase sigma factor [Bacteroidales bacterium]|nr:sigma-70 family RNA polymerase sigma factor [Bacteroidales bacterium]